ncbi:MAG: chromosomal replication initiator protein DnaA [Actinomycetota bacterium]|nr:chromosomal replication initiator protein DnaA [Actinomycetota bacterium]
MHEKIEAVWRETLNILKQRLNVPTFKTWFENTTPLTIFEDTLIVSAPNAFAKEWLESRYTTLLSDALSQVVGERMNVKFAIQGERQEHIGTKDVPRLKHLPAMSADRQEQSHNFLNPKYTFDSFVIGASNRFAHAAALAVAEKPSQAYNPLFIYGGVGLGKTHLLQAIGHYVMRHYPDLKVKYVSSEKFTNDFINSIRDKGKIVGFQKRYRDNDVLLVDDIQFLENKEATQEEFFHTFNTLYEAGKQIVISSDRPPKDIATLEDRLRSRFEWGLITDIQPPDLETRIAILRKKAEIQSLEIRDDVLEYIASKIQSNIRELEGALIRIIAYSSLTKSEISLSLAQEVLKDIFPSGESRPITIRTIQEEVCKYYNISRTELISNKRSQSIVYPRQIAMYLARELTDLSLSKIGEKFGGRDHTTVLHAILKIEKLINEQREVYNQIQELTNRIKQKT